ncbi:DNA-processing protein DprA [Thiomicrorhabdus sp. ZW0627]|uniref:DNA-processing protein DprA n=1 Tax=Thiomicrorhabdus sp. ZW0627 TaxID=3039774 RepID=UPI0024365B52|nr:DNA-processing protein DprA [Thiomicrorhabdus sp. ZW0627]MDG6774483.1 DNA-processing protein DprA [Thiomicrorhabdus sp. ZW0627]
MQKTVAHFGSLKTALQATQADWQNAKIVGDKQVDGLFDDALEKRIDETLEWGQGSGQELLAIGADEFPDMLKKIDDPPVLLSARGSVSLLNDPQLAIVGSRHASRQGVNTAKDFAHFLSDQGLGIVSGLALGIDTAAHEGGLLGIGKTVAVVATGLDRIYPAANKALAHQIVEEGAMVSEFPLGTKPLAYNFPKRNRIISGLSVGTLVIEAAVQSGSLITAKTALDQGREVFAVPGSINNPQAKGCHQLIKQGAKLVESGQDVLEELVSVLGIDWTAEREKDQSLSEGASGDSNTSPKNGILRYMEYEPVGLDELVVLSKMPVYEIQSQLTMLELSGEIEAMSAGRWRRIR